MDLDKFDKPLSELAWDIVKSTKQPNAFLAIAEYLQPLKDVEPDKALKLGMNLIPLVEEGLKTFYSLMNEDREVPESGNYDVQMNTMDLAAREPEAYDALPEAYQSDDVMIFYYENGVLYGKPRSSEISIVGDWKVSFDPDTKTWVEETLDEKPV